MSHLTIIGLNHLSIPLLESHEKHAHKQGNAPLVSSNIKGIVLMLSISLSVALFWGILDMAFYWFFMLKHLHDVAKQSFFLYPSFFNKKLLLKIHLTATAVIKYVWNNNLDNILYM